jgi:hypothetical protein
LSPISTLRHHCRAGHAQLEQPRPR